MSWIHRLGFPSTFRNAQVNPVRRGSQKRRHRFTPDGQPLEARLLLTSQPHVSETFLVTNNQDLTSNGGVVAGSLRAAIDAANANTGVLNYIEFKIGSGVQTIALKAALPAITNPVDLDGLTQPGYAGTPLIVLSGAGAGAGAIGLNIEAGNSDVYALAIDSFGGDGVRLSGGNNNILFNDYIGVDATGTLARGNGGDGVDIINSANNEIGYPGSTIRDVISGNTGDGVAITTYFVPTLIGKTNPATGNEIRGDYIGTNAAGTAALGNHADGVHVSAASNTIGPGNVISGNLGNGVALVSGALLGQLSTANTVTGNLIGSNASGTAQVPNQLDGVSIENAAGNTIGGTTAAARNMISGNVQSNVLITGASASGNVVEGNYIGTNAAGTAVLGIDNTAGVEIAGASDNTIGGTVAGARNLISGGAGGGVDLYDTGTNGNVVEGNYIGTDVTGTYAIPNNAGVFIGQGPAGNTIGGTVPGARNIISGNKGDGIELTQVGTINAQGNHPAGNTIEGNYIGTNAAGTAALGNPNGVVLNEASFVTISGNVISGNNGAGIDIFGESTSASVGNTVLNNLIGLSASGSGALPNTGDGILLGSDADANAVGGTAAGSRNVISGNGVTGVSIQGTGAVDNVVEGNLIGTDVTGTKAVSNTDYGVFVTTAGNTIGGTVPGARNVISGNGDVGLFIFGSAAQSNLVEGNYIGTDVTGQKAVPNRAYGLIVSQGAGNVIGGPAAGAGNVISGNAGPGITLENVDETTIQGNLIGLNATANSLIPNASDGIDLITNSNANLIGGLNPGDGNTIAFNNGVGVAVESGTGNAILTNSIYLNAGLGIALSPPGANLLQAAPTLTSAVSNGTGITVKGSLQGTAGSTYLIQFFSNLLPDPSGFGEGQTLIGSLTVKVPQGETGISFKATLPAVQAGEFITATATDVTLDSSGDPANNTSQFSNAVEL